MRSWAIFENLFNLGFEPYLFIDKDTSVDLELPEKFVNNLVIGKNNQSVAALGLDALVLCGTKIQLALKLNPWVDLATLNVPICLAQCYHNDFSKIHTDIISNIFAAGFVSPIYSRHWNSQYPNIPTFTLTTGQVQRPAIKGPPYRRAVFIVIIDSWDTFGKILDVAKIDLSIEYAIITYRRPIPNGEFGQYIDLNTTASDNSQTLFIPSRKHQTVRLRVLPNCRLSRN